MQVNFLDRYSGGTSLVHRLDARLKLLLATFLAVLVIATPELVGVLFAERWAVWFFLGAEAWVVLVIYAVSGLPWRYLAWRLLALLPFLLVLALGVPLTRGFDTGWNQGAQLLARSLMSLTLMITVVATTPFGRLLAALERLHVARVFISIVAFMYRYMFVFWDELEKMRRAKLARTFYPSVWWEARSRGTFVGILFVRAFERAERVHAAMLARGWRGQVPTKDGEP
jgi:cobalt/nickel transport system permease protein